MMEIQEVCSSEGTGLIFLVSDFIIMWIAPVIYLWQYFGCFKDGRNTYSVLSAILLLYTNGLSRDIQERTT